jgi:hypothetical protein
MATVTQWSETETSAFISEYVRLSLRYNNRKPQYHGSEFVAVAANYIANRTNEFHHDQETGRDWLMNTTRSCGSWRPVIGNSEC